MNTGKKKKKDGSAASAASAPRLSKETLSVWLIIMHTWTRYVQKKNMRVEACRIN